MNDTSTLLTDLYQLTMLQGYFQYGMEETAVFELFVRKLPFNRSFLVAAGLEQALDYLENFHVSAEECDWLERSGLFSADFLGYLSRLRFTGTVHAMPEGTVFFGNEPILRVTAPLPQAQIVETRLINLLQLQSLLASKAARCVLAAPGKPLVEFGLRRAHGSEAGMMAARAAYIAGFTGTSNVLAAKSFGIPMFGTMAHSFIMAHDDESAAFERFALAQPGNVTLLIDTYDTLAGAAKVVALAPRLAERGIVVRAVRLDSGDLGALAKQVRAILDRGGLSATRIMATGDLDEDELERLLNDKAPIDFFGIGTRLTTSADAPYFNCAYKLQEYAGAARRKRSPGKQTWPGRKQVWRRYDGVGRMLEDTLALETEEVPGTALLGSVMEGGRRLAPPQDLAGIRDYCAGQLAALPPSLTGLHSREAYPVCVSPAVMKLAAQLDELSRVSG